MLVPEQVVDGISGWQAELSGISSNNESVSESSSESDSCRSQVSSRNDGGS